MAGSDKFVYPMQKRVFTVFLPRAKRRIRRGIADCIILAPEIVGRIEQIIQAVPFQNGRTFGHLTKHHFPGLDRFDALCQRLLLDFLQIIFQFCTPNHITVCKADKIKIGLPILIEKDGCIDSFFFSNRLLFILHERSQRRIGRGNTNVLLYRIEHIKLLVLLHIIDFRCPKPFIPVRVFFTQCQTGRTLPRLQIFRTVHLETVRTGCSISIIGIVVKQDIRIGNRQHIRNRLFPYGSHTYRNNTQQHQ